jgi:SAM-dependent methyltransferase
LSDGGSIPPASTNTQTGHPPGGLFVFLAPYNHALRAEEPALSSTDKAFVGSIPKVYESHLVPLLFQSYADDLARRVSEREPSRVLEIAAGTGVVTRVLSSALGKRVAIVASDLNQAMIDQAAAVGTEHTVEWRQADAMALPFTDASFDVVVCQFGVMFFPDKAKAFAEARRVLKRGGIFIFNVWDRIAENEFADVITTALEAVFPDDPPRFLPRTPYGYHDRATIESDLGRGGFKKRAKLETLAARSRAASADEPAIAFCQGTPLRMEIEARDPMRLRQATDTAASAIAQRFGRGPVDGKIQAHVVTVKA